MIKGISETQSNLELTRNLSEHTLESISDNHGNNENISYAFLKKVEKF